jgi:hypothetical protein
MATPYMKRGSVQPAQMSRHHKMMGIKICDSMLVSQPSINKSINRNPRHLLLVADPAPSKGASGGMAWGSPGSALDARWLTMKIDLSFG